MTYYQQPTVRAIRAALEEVPGAMRDEPYPEDVDEQKDCYSVRVKGSLRAHLRYDRNQAVWFAEAIGDHKAMGRG